MPKLEPPPRGARRSATTDPVTLMNDPTFQDLVRRRSAFAWTLSAIMLAIYLVFVFLVAFAKPLMATPLFGGTTSLGILLGLLIIIVAFAMTGLYVSRANSVFDPLSAELKRKVR